MRSTIPITLLAALLAAAPSFASTAASDPVGFTRQTIHHGRQTLGLTLNHPIVVSATIVASDSRAVLLDPAIGDISARLDSNAAYYAEIVGDTKNTFSGDRFDIDVEATRASHDSLLFFKDADHNSTAASFPPDALLGHRVVIRKHLTVAGVFGTRNSSVLQAGFRYEEADSLLFFDRRAGGYAIYYLCRTESGPAEWRKLGAVGSMNDTIIAPGTGLFVHRMSDASVDFVAHGAVRTNDFVLPLQAGYNLVSSPYPVTDTPASLQISSANGFAAAKEAGQADQILVFNGDAYDSYFLESSATSGDELWRRSGDNAGCLTTVELLSRDRSVFIKKIAADPDFIVHRSFPL
ncbi:MAG TPA: hypothetical protein VGA56_05725 [Opitutaceae bacterium]